MTRTMAKVTRRLGDARRSAVGVEAELEGKRANAFMAHALTAVTDPTTTGEAFERVRDRLRRARAGDASPAAAPGRRAPA